MLFAAPSREEKISGGILEGAIELVLISQFRLTMAEAGPCGVPIRHGSI